MSYRVGDIVKAAQTIECGSMRIRINSQGVVTAVVRKGLSKQYTVQWSNVTLTVAAKLIAPTGKRAIIK